MMAIKKQTIGFTQSSAFYLTHQSKSVEITPISNLGFANSTTACCGSSPVPALARRQTVNPLKSSFFGNFAVKEILCQSAFAKDLLL